MVPFRLSPLLLSVPLLVVLCACGHDPSDPEPLGEAYAGPASLELRQDISRRARVSGIAKHGDRLEVLEAKRRFVRVKTPQGQQGWVNVGTLISSDQMKDLRALADYARQLPSEGKATSFEMVNVHIEPNRRAPSFSQLPEKSTVEIVGRKVMPRTQDAPPVMSFRRKRTPRRPPPKKKPVGINLSPPPPPGLPENWIALSKSPEIKEPPKSPAEELQDRRLQRLRKKEEPAVDDWILIRMKDGSAGWALSRMLSMAIPDDVAQYSEGQRITSYFSLGDIQDEEHGLKSHWLWTTMSGVRSDCDFDGFRVFIWNRRRHRYETAYRERHLIGQYPVRANLDGKTGTFALITQNDDGKWVRRTFFLDGYQVRKLGEEPFVPGETPAAQEAEAKAAERAAKSGWFSSFKQRVQKLFKK